MPPYDPRQYGTVPGKRRRSRLWLILSVIAVAVLAVCGIGACLSLNEAANDAAVQLGETQATVAPAVKGVPAAPRGDGKSGKPNPKLSDLELTVKTTDKDCFGSAGCNVQYQIKAALSSSVTVKDQCEVTYEVHGLDDTQIGTLTLKSDGTYSQDQWQTGQTPRSTSKLTAKATEIDCS